MLAPIRTAMALLLTLVSLASNAYAQANERRFALVIGNAEYASGALPTAANDAGLIAQTLQAAGFDVMGARDLDGESLRRTFRDFADKVSGAGPDAVAFVYLAGHGLQYEGDNYFAGIDAKIERDVDVPSHALRVNDFLRPLASAKSKALIVVMDTARENPYAHTGNPLAGGMALVEPTPGTLYAFNAAPGTLAQTETEAYGAYARALAEMMREGGLPVNALFDRVRLRVNEETQGASLPWHASKIDVPFEFFERAPEAPKVEARHELNVERRAKPMRAFNEAEEAYFAALERDTLGGYLDFLDAYPNSKWAKRVQAIVASRREAIAWRKTRNADTPNAYWTYLDTYPEGPHAWDARRRLDYLTAPPLPPPSFTRFIYDDLPPPYEYEYVYVHRRPAFWFYDPVFAFAPPPLVPVWYLPPPLPRLYFAPPPRPVYAYVLPAPAYVPVATFVVTPRAVVPPPGNPFNGRIHQAVAAPPVTALAPAGAAPVAPGGPPAGGIVGPGPGAGHSGPGIGTAVAVGAAAGAAAAIVASRVALPASVAQKAVNAPPRPAGAPVAASAPVLQPGQNRALRPGMTGGPALIVGKPVVPAPPVLGSTGGISNPGSSNPGAGRQATGGPAGRPIPTPPAMPTNTPPSSGTPSILTPRTATGSPTPPIATPPSNNAAATAAAERARADQAAQAARDRQQQQQQAQAAQAARERQQQQAAQQAAQAARDRAQQQAAQAARERAQQQQAAQAAQARAQQQAAQAAQARAQQQAAQAARERAQQQAAQAQAQAQARAAQQQAAQARAAQQQRPKCGVPNMPPCR